MHRIHFILVSACVSVAHHVHAQTTVDTTLRPFRRGQWGVEFIPSRSLAEGGVLRFSTPTRAWVLDAWAAFDYQTRSGTGVSSTAESARSISVSARVGPRWFHSQYERVVRFVGLGVTGSYSSSSQSLGSSSRDESWSGGVYGELGLQYLFTPHLGLGVRGDVVGLRNGLHLTQQGPGGSTTERLTSYHVALEPLQVIGAFYF